MGYKTCLSAYFNCKVRIQGNVHTEIQPGRSSILIKKMIKILTAWYVFLVEP